MLKNIILNKSTNGPSIKNENFFWERILVISKPKFLWTKNLNNVKYFHYEPKLH